MKFVDENKVSIFLYFDYKSIFDNYILREERKLLLDTI